MKEKVALFPGSFDPFTIGHEEIIKRGLAVFDKIIISIGINSQKKGFMPIEARIKFIEKVFEAFPQVEVTTYEGLTIEYCRQVGATVMLRGLRTAADFEYERAIGQANRALNSEIETMFMLTSAEHTYISSSIVRNIFENGGNIDQFIPINTNTEFLQSLLTK